MSVASSIRQRNAISRGNCLLWPASCWLPNPNVSAHRGTILVGGQGRVSKLATGKSGTDEPIFRMHRADFEQQRDADLGRQHIIGRERRQSGRFTMDHSELFRANRNHGLNLHSQAPIIGSDSRVKDWQNDQFEGTVVHALRAKHRAAQNRSLRSVEWSNGSKLLA
jgi:hypothetical protein